MFRSHHFFVLVGEARKHFAHFLTSFLTGKLLVAPNFTHLGADLFPIAFAKGAHLLHLGGSDVKLLAHAPAAEFLFQVLIKETGDGGHGIVAGIIETLKVVDYTPLRRDVLAGSAIVCKLFDKCLRIGYHAFNLHLGLDDFHFGGAAGFSLGLSKLLS